jgi:group I intron endonuclease
MKIFRELIEFFLADSTTKSIPRASGIYQIRCVPTGKIYVGSAVDLRTRWQHHCELLRRHKHRNKYLQAAWDKYGPASFELDILELTAREHLLEREQEWINQTRCTDREIGFNLYNTAGSPGEKFAQVWHGFIDPHGNEVVITNLEEFCRENGLNAQIMRQIANGKSKHKGHRGWSHKSNPRQREYVKTWEGFIEPNGNPVGTITNLAAFCREHGLDDTHMVALAQGKLHSHKGWTHSNKREHLGHKTYRGFVSPQGERVVITKLQDFCRKNGLHSVHMHQLINGQRKSHKGWTWGSQNENE